MFCILVMIGQGTLAAPAWYSNLLPHCCSSRGTRIQSLEQGNVVSEGGLNKNIQETGGSAIATENTENIGTALTNENPRTAERASEAVDDPLTPKERSISDLNKPRIDPEMIKKIDAALKVARSIPWESLPTRFLHELQKIGSFDKLLLDKWAKGTTVTQQYGAVIKAAQDWNGAKTALEKAHAEFKRMNNGMTALQVDRQFMETSQIGQEIKKNGLAASEVALQGNQKESDRLYALVEKGHLEAQKQMRRINGFIELETKQNEEVLKLNAFYKKLDELQSPRETHNRQPN